MVHINMFSPLAYLPFYVLGIFLQLALSSATFKESMIFQPHEVMRYLLILFSNNYKF